MTSKITEGSVSEKKGPYYSVQKKKSLKYDSSKWGGG